MSINSFTFNGVSSEDMSLYVGGQKTFGAPQRDVTKVSIPGRNGDLVRDNGRFLNSEIAYNIVAMDGFKETAQNVRNWLMSAKGYKRLEDTYHPDHYRMARVSGTIDFETGAYNATGKAQILFDCMPQRFLKSGEEISDASMVDHTESGDILSFETVAEDDMTKVEVAITPVQSFNGYDHPWAGGANLNLLPKNATDGTETKNSVTLTATNGVYVLSGTSNGMTTFNIPLSATVNLSPSINKICFLNSKAISSVEVAFVRGTTKVHYWGMSSQNRVAEWWTDSGNENVDTIEIKVYNNINTDGMTISPMLVKLTDTTPTTFSPWENICPISGWSAANVYRTGVNVWDEMWEVGSYNAGIPTVQKYNDSTHIRSKNPISVKPNKTYYMNTAGYSVHLIVADLSGNVLYRTTSLNNGTFTTPNNSAYVYFNMAQTYGTTYNNDISINYPSTNTAYAPYSGNSVTFTFGQTVYGGTLNIDGTVTVTHVSETITKDDAWYSFSTGTGNSSAVVQLTNYQNVKYVDGSSSYNGAISSVAVELQNYWVNARQNEVCADMGFAYSSTGQLRVHRTDVANITDLASFEANFPDMQIVFELSTPTTITLTEKSLSTLLGTNNVWADCGATEIEYAEPCVIENPTPFESKPLIRVYGSGTCTVTVNNQIITINNVTDFVDIDCETMNCYNGVVNKNADVVLGAQGFPVLPAGKQ